MLGRAGVQALLIERQREPREVVCGGFLGRDALVALRRLGIDPLALGAHAIGGVRIIAGEQQMEAALPFAAAGLSRRTLDAALLQGAEATGVGVERGVTIRSAEGPPSFRLRLADGGTIDADALFLATGKHELRGLARPHDAAGEDPAIGLRTRLEAPPALVRALHGVIELHLFEHGYAGLLRQEDGSINLCLSIARSRLAAEGVEALLAAIAGEAPRLADRIAAATAVAPWQAVASVPYGWRARAGEAGLFRLGDQAAVIASLAGDGVAIALASGRMAALAFTRDGPAGAAAFQRRFAHRAHRPLVVASALRLLAERPHAAMILPLLAAVPGLTGLLARLTRIRA